MGRALNKAKSKLGKRPLPTVADAEKRVALHSVAQKSSATCKVIDTSTKSGQRALGKYFRNKDAEIERLENENLHIAWAECCGVGAECDW
jgi:hypothetical protein